MKKILLEDALILSFVKALRWLVHVLPLKASLFIARGVGALVFSLTARREIAYKNLKAAFAEQMTRDQMMGIARRSIQNMIMSGIELLRFPDLTLDYVKEHVKITGIERFEPFLNEKKGIIFLTAHFGNWELLSVTSSMIGYPMVALARAQKHPRSDEFLNSMRTSQGSQVIRKGMPIREILKALKNGRIVGILSDQDGGRNGTFVRFFNRLSSTPSGVATFAFRTGAPIFPVFIERDGWLKHRVEVEGPLTMPDLSLSAEEAERMILQQFAEALEAKIRKTPDQWLWAHRRWKSTPNRSVLILSDGKAGHLNQSLAVSEAIQEARRHQGIAPELTRFKVIEIHFKNNFLAKAFQIFCILTQGRLPFKPWLLKTLLARNCYTEIMKTYADAVISCGSSLLGINLLVRHENQAKSLVVMKPSFSPRRFDVVIAPRHDKMKPEKNIFITDRSLSLITDDYLETEAEKLLDELRLGPHNKKIGFLVGGDTAAINFSKPLFEKALEGLKRYSRESDSVVLATSSRRTPAWADELLKRNFKGDTRCPLLVIANEANRKGVMGGILGLSDIVIVSGESISMVSEAVSSGKPVVVFMPWEKGKIKPKYQAFLDRMAKEGLIVTAGSENIYETIGKQFELSGERSGSVLLKDRDTLLEAVKKIA